MLRMLLTPRWLGWTLLAVLAVAVCGAMAWWQVVRLESPGGSLLNAGYAFQWPLFAVFFAFLWWRMLRAEARSVPVPAPAPEHGDPDPDPGSDPGSVRAPDASSPFGPRPAGVGPGGDAPVPGSARARHNAHFAELAGRRAAEPTREDPP